MSDIAVHRQLASLQTSVEHLTAAMTSMATQWASQDAAAAVGRKSLHEKFEAFRNDVGLQVAGLSLRVDRMVDTMTKIEPAVKNYEDEKLRREGAKKLGGALIAALTAVAGTIGWGLHEFIGYIHR